MKDSSLVELLVTFSAREMKDFAAFLESPYPVKKHYKIESKLLFDWLSKSHPGFDGSRLQKERVFGAVFPNESFSEGKLEKVMTELSKSAKTFLLIEQYLHESNHEVVHTDLAKIYFERQLFRKAENQLIAVEAKIKAKKTQDAQDFEGLYKVALIQRDLSSINNTWKKDLNIGISVRQLNLYYAASKIPLLNHLFILKKLSKIDTNIDLEAELNGLSNITIEISDSPSIFIMLQILNLYKSTPNIELGNKTWTLLKENVKDLNQEEIKSSYAHLRSYFSSLVIIHDGLWSVLHEIQKENLKHGLLYSFDMIAPGTFVNVTVVALRSGNDDWADSFIEEHKFKIIGDNETHDFYRLGKAWHLFYSKKFNDSLDFLPASSPNLDLHLSARRLELMTYFELKSDLLTFKLDAFKMYLSRGHRKTLSKEIYETNNNFLNILIQITQTTPGDNSRCDLILNRVAEKQQMFSKEWLIEKAKALANSKN